MEFIGSTFSIILGKLMKVMRDTYPQKSLSQSDIAKVLDTSVMSISRLEKGTAELSVSDLERLAQFFEIPADTLLTIAIKIKNIFIEQKCLILANKHEAKKMKNLKMIDHLMIYELCKKVYQQYKR